MPDSRPGISFDNDGVCSACRAYEQQKQIDWNQRYGELEKLCDKYRGMNGNSYDCAIAVSGGKDSHYQVHLMKEVMGMNPILFTVEDNFPMTNAGIHNLKNISEEFGCNIISLKPDIKTQKKLMRYTFEKYGKPTWFIDRLIYTFPLHMALKFNTPLLVYGENVSYVYGGNASEDVYSAKNQLLNGVASDIDLNELIQQTDVSMKELEITIPPTKEDMNKLDPMYVSYFVPWNSYANYKFAQSRGFHDLSQEWKRRHCVEDFNQVDTRAYIVNGWMKYPKFGHAPATDLAARFVRYGMITREEAIKLVKEHDHDLDVRCVQEYAEFCGYSETEFWKIVDSFYNKDIFEKNEFGEWVLKNPIWKET